MKIAKIRDVKTPGRGTNKSAGIDFYIPNGFVEQLVVPNCGIVIPSGIKAKIPEGYMLTAYNKSGIATKHNLIVGAQVCDEDYQGEIHLHVINVGKSAVSLLPGMKLSQFILQRVSYEDVEVVDEKILFDDTISERGEGKFGSTGNF